MKNAKKPRNKAKKAVDSFSGKRGRGRPEGIPHSWVTGRAHNYRVALTHVWPRLGGPLLAATTEAEVVSVFESYGQPYTGQFVPAMASDLLTLLRDPDFPKTAKARIGFLADSLGGRPSLSYRRSRDICGEERTEKAAESPHRIIRKEFYIECSCGYKGPARDNACRKCGAGIPVILWDNSGLLTEFD